MIKRRGWDLNPKARKGTSFLACGQRRESRNPVGRALGYFETSAIPDSATSA